MDRATKTVDDAATPHTDSGWTTLTDHERDQFDRDGYVVLRGALSDTELAHARDSVCEAFAAAKGRRSLGDTGSMHQLSAVTHAPGLASLIDHPSTFRYVWSLLGWNVHIYHSHVDVHPQLTSPAPFHWHWHQDGGRLNRELDGDPRPRMAVKVSYWLSDVSRVASTDVVFDSRC